MGENFEILPEDGAEKPQEKPKSTLERLTPAEQKALIEQHRSQSDSNWTTRTHRKLKSNPDLAWLGITILCAFILGFATAFVVLALLMWMFKVTPANLATFLVAVGAIIATAFGTKIAAGINLASAPGVIAQKLQLKADKDPAEYDEKGFTIPQVHQG